MGHSLTSTQTYLAMQLQKENTNEKIFIEIESNTLHLILVH